MQRRIRITLALTAITALGASAAAFAAPGNKYPRTTDARDCGNGDQVIFSGAKELWPPNHKYQSLTVTADGSDDTENVSIMTSITSSEDEFEIGSGHTAADAMPPMAADDGMGEASVSHMVRAERSGRNKDGRTYTIDAHATFDNGSKSCDETFVVHVAHDQRGGAGWKGL